ncbi:MAG: N-acetylneuraminate synthase, partial [Ghiorsea sp.]|nr:N-acetylneuraminate synthase [Ghiorsea sp.]
MSCYIIAEAGVNHNGSEEMAFQLVDAAAEAGADAVKFQTFKAESLVQKGAAKAEYQKEHTEAGDQFEMLKALELSDAVHMRLAERCKQKGIGFLSTGFDENSIEMLLNLGMERLKIPSGELTNKPYIDFIAGKDCPIILSTGMATLDEVADAVAWVKVVRGEKGLLSPLEGVLTILHCTSNYPTPLASVNLKAMQTMKREFGMPIGYSDHTAGILISPMAVAMGATVIEKHFTLDKNLPGPDHQASLEPSELQQMIEDIRVVELSLGDGVKIPTVEELEVRKVVRRSI